MHNYTGTLVLIRLNKKADLPETKVNCTKHRKVRKDENLSFDLGKNGHHRFRYLGSKFIIVVRQAHKTLAVYKFYKIWQLQFWNILRLLNIFIMSMTL